MSTALPSRRESLSPFFKVEVSAVLQQFEMLQQFNAELAEVEKRLGTPDEQPADYERARELAHVIRNKVHVLSLLGIVGA